MIQLLSPKDGAEFSQQTPEQIQFAKISGAETTPQKMDWLNLIRSETPDHSQPKPILCRWRGTVKQAAAECAEDPRFRVGKLSFEAEPGKKSVEMHSLKTGTTYYCRVVGLDSNGAKIRSEVHSFRTAVEAPRWIRVDGVSNVRDCGGWRTKDGHFVRQGVLFRGGEPNRHMTIEASGIRFMEDQLRIRTVLDMRCEEELSHVGGNGAALAPSVKWINIPMRPYTEIFSELQRGYYARAFRLLKKPNFPLYFHCWGGADRTGTFTLLINALLGVDDELLIRDYELTTLAIWGERSRHSDYFRGLSAGLDELAPGANLETKARAYFHSCGITDREIADLRKRLLV